MDLSIYNRLGLPDQFDVHDVLGLVPADHDVNEGSSVVMNNRIPSSEGLVMAWLLQYTLTNQ